jgi:predicted dehydrogenase
MKSGPSTIRVCLVGTGRAGRVHAGSLTHHVPGGELVAVVDSAPDRASEAAAEYGLDQHFAGLDDALAWGAFDAVVITTPTFTHRALAVTAASAGKHVLVEKPMALSLAECDEMAEAARAGGVLLQIGFMRRFDPEFAAAHERIQAGEIGRPMLVKSLTHGPGLPPAWARDLRTSNGMLAEVNSHDWDSTRWLMDSNPRRVYVEVANFKGAANHVDTPSFYDNVVVSLQFESGGLGTITGVCPCEYGYDARVEIVGERGIMQIGDLRGQAVIVGTDRQRGYLTPIYQTWLQRFAWGYIHEMEHFVQCIVTGTPPLAGAEDGRWAVAGVLAGTKSFQEERPVLLSDILDPAIIR